MTEKGKTRFEMVKERHYKTYHTALKQGKVDEQMIGLCSYIANTKNFYTSSCCSGRILLLEKQGDKKIETFFHRKWHREAKEEELIEGFYEKTKGNIWFKVDPFILHIGCKNLQDANRILKVMKKAGVKRGGIILAEKEKFLIEMQGTETMSFPIKKGEKKLVSEEYLKEILKEANLLLGKNYKRLYKLEAEMKKALK